MATDHYDPEHNEGTVDLNEKYENSGIVFHEDCIYGEDANDNDVKPLYIICSGCRSFLTRDVPWEN